MDNNSFDRVLRIIEDPDGTLFPYNTFHNLIYCSCLMKNIPFTLYLLHNEYYTYEELRLILVIVCNYCCDELFDEIIDTLNERKTPIDIDDWGMFLYDITLTGNKSFLEKFIEKTLVDSRLTNDKKSVIVDILKDLRYKDESIKGSTEILEKKMKQ